MSKNLPAKQAVGLDVIAHLNTEGLTDVEKAELAQIYAQELDVSSTGFEFRPSRIAIQRDSCTFADALGRSMDELVGIIVFKHTTRGLWERGNKIPLCSSMDGITGIDEDEIEKNCATCEHNQWGSGVDETGMATDGKACKEMRRVFVAQKDALLPVFISLPPTSLKPFDEYCSARLSENIPDVAVETIFRLTPQTTKRGYKNAVIQCKMGRKLHPKEMLKYINMRSKIVAAAQRIGITDEDYMQEADDEQPF